MIAGANYLVYRVITKSKALGMTVVLCSVFVNSKYVCFIKAMQLYLRPEVLTEVEIPVMVLWFLVLL